MDKYAEVARIRDRLCKLMGWEPHSEAVSTAIRAVLMGKAIVLSVEKADQIAERLEACPAGSDGVCEHGVKDGEWCEPCNREYKTARKDNDSA